MINKITSALLVCMFIGLWQTMANAGVVTEEPFNNYFDHDGKLNADKLVDAMRNNEIDAENKITVQFLEARTILDLQILRNTFYAKHGLIFKTRELQNYFNRKPWYVPQASHVVLPDKEQKIVSAIKRIENCENVKFDEFHKLFTPLSLPLTYGEDLKRQAISMVNIRKFLNPKHDIYLPYYAIGELHRNGFIVFLYEISSLETQPCIATFSLDGKLISNKAFFSIGGDLTSSTEGNLFIEKDLTIHIRIEDFSNNKLFKTRHEKYHIDVNGNIKQFK